MRPKHKKDQKTGRKKWYYKPPKWFSRLYNKKYRRACKQAVDAGKEPPASKHDCSWDWD